MRPWTTSRRLRTAVQIGAVAAALTLSAPALLSTRAVFANETSRPAASAATPHTAKGDSVLEGTLEILHEDREDGRSQNHHFLSTADGRRLALEGVPPGHDLLTGDRVRVRGSRSDNALRLQPSSGASAMSTASGASLEVLTQAPLSNTFGPQKTAVLLVNFSNDQSRPMTVAGTHAVMAESDAFFRENSYGQTSLTWDIFGWYTLPITITAGSACPIGSIATSAEQAATAAGVNLAPYTRRVYLFPQSLCGWAGWSTIGGNPSRAWINGLVVGSTLTHELGHSFGLYHSHALRCQPGISVGTSSPSGIPCWTPLDYGDITDTMGGAPGHFNAFQKARLGWLDYDVSPPITTVQTSDAYTIDAYEFSGTTPKALKIPRGTTGQSFFVELRRNVGWDTSLYRTGVFVHLATDTDPNSSLLLDMTPATTLFEDGFLDVGKSFTDPASGITLTTLSVGSTSATVQVTMDSAASCLRSAPNVIASPGQSLGVPAGTAVTYNVSVTNTDSAGCAAASFTLQATTPTTNWQKSFGAASVTAAPGATVSTTLRITSPTVPTGSYFIVSAATHTSPSPLSGSASMLYNVAPGSPPAPPAPPAPPTPTVTDLFDRPDAPVLSNGWLVMAGSLMIQSGEARNQPASTFSLAVQPGFLGATQLAAASFASANNNSAPRFGVIVRYQNPQNYYVCYRQVGGSSLVRIAKVQNGVETVLTSIGIPNPALNGFSALSCQASGSTLTLRINGVTKLSVSNGTFTAGSAGFTISTKSGAAHRADNFSVTTP